MPLERQGELPTRRGLRLSRGQVPRHDPQVRSLRDVLVSSALSEIWFSSEAVPMIDPFYPFL